MKSSAKKPEMTDDYFAKLCDGARNGDYLEEQIYCYIDFLEEESSKTADPSNQFYERILNALSILLGGKIEHDSLIDWVVFATLNCAEKIGYDTCCKEHGIPPFNPDDYDLSDL